MTGAGRASPLRQPRPSRQPGPGSRSRPESPRGKLAGALSTRSKLTPSQEAMSLEDAFNFRDLTKSAASNAHSTAATTVLPGGLRVQPMLDAHTQQQYLPEHLGSLLHGAEADQQAQAAEQLPSSSTLSSPPARPSEHAFEVHVEIGRDSSISPPPAPSPLSPRPVDYNFDEATHSSFAAVLRASYVKANPQLAAQVLLNLLEANASLSITDSVFHTRPMSLEDRKDLISVMRATENNAFWGALLDSVRGRLMLASWLRNTIEYPEWSSTRLPLLRLINAMPVLSDHLIDDSTKNCLIKAVNFVVKNAPQKSKELAVDLKEKWKRMVVDAENGEQAVTNVKRPASSGSEPPPSKKVKPATNSASSSTTYNPAPTPMQTMNNLSQTSAYLTAVSHLANPSSASAASTSKLSTSSGPQRAGDLQGISKKTVTRQDPEVKQLCNRCKSVLIPGITSATRIKASGPHGQRIDQTCLKCKEKAKKTPAPSLPKTAKRLAIDVSDDDSGGGSKNVSGTARKSVSVASSAAPASKGTQPSGRRANTAKDMFSDLLRGPPSAKGKAAVSSPTTKAEGQTKGGPTKPKKKVRWREDNLVEVRLFESVVDIDADVHASIEDRGLHGLDSDEGNAFKKAAHAFELEEELDWYEPSDVAVQDPSPERGTDSEEAKRLESRERSTLSAIYVESSDIPASAGEPHEVRAFDPDHIIEQIALPDGWEDHGMRNGSIDLEQLMRQIAGGDVTSAADVPATSLESLGISSDGLQQLLMNSGGAGGEQSLPLPSAYQNAGQGAMSTSAWGAAPNFPRQGHSTSTSYPFGAPQTTSYPGYPQHPGPPPPPPPPAPLSGGQLQSAYQGGFRGAGAPPPTGPSGKRRWGGK